MYLMTNGACFLWLKLPLSAGNFSDETFFPAAHRYKRTNPWLLFSQALLQHREDLGDDLLECFLSTFEELGPRPSHATDVKGGHRMYSICR